IYGFRSVGFALLSRAALVFFPGEFIHRGVLHDFLAGNLPGFLNDPRERTVLTSRLILDLLQHLFGKVQALLALVGTAHWMTKPPVVVVEVGQCKISHGRVSRNASMALLRAGRRRPGLEGTRAGPAQRRRVRSTTVDNDSRERR